MQHQWHVILPCCSAARAALSYQFPSVKLESHNRGPHRTTRSTQRHCETRRQGLRERYPYSHKASQEFMGTKSRLISSPHASNLLNRGLGTKAGVKSSDGQACPSEVKTGKAVRHTFRNLSILTEASTEGESDIRQVHGRV